MLLTSKNFVFFDLTYYKNFASENGRGRVAKTHELPPPPLPSNHPPPLCVYTLGNE